MMRRRPAGAKLRPIGFAQFRASLAARTPPKALSPAVEALWHVANGNWERAHDLAQRRDDAAGAWVHAHLHRVEGDTDNARYWYGRAGRAISTAAHGKEWEQIANALLKRN